MRPSLLDRADLGRLRAVAARLPGPFATVVAGLVDGGALAHDPEDPTWEDRDRVVTGDDAAAAAVRAALLSAGQHEDAGPVETEPWEALPLAAGLAAGSRLDGGAFRTWALLGPAAVQHGAFWEAARLVAGERLTTLTVVVVGPPAPVGEATRVLDLAGWRTNRVAADDPAEVLSGLEQMSTADAPGAVLASVR